MISRNQINRLTKLYKIDQFTIWREYLQLVFLNHLYSQSASERIFFKGGTAIRFLFASPRFSEDLDFSTPYSYEKIKKILAVVEKEMRRELAPIKILSLYRGKNGCRFRLKYQAIKFKYPLVIRLDFNFDRPILSSAASPLITRFPLMFFPIVIHLKRKEIMAEKLAALFTRGKGRDFFDVWFLQTKGVAINKNLINSKLKKNTNKHFKLDLLINKIKKYPDRELKRDLEKFLPRTQRKLIGLLKLQLIHNFEELNSPKLTN